MCTTNCNSSLEDKKKTLFVVLARGDNKRLVNTKNSNSYQYDRKNTPSVVLARGYNDRCALAQLIVILLDGIRRGPCLRGENKRCAQARQTRILL